MKIGFEAKRIFHNKTGLGNYSRDLVRMLNTYYPNNDFLLYNPKKATQNLFSFSSDSIQEKLPQSSFHKKFYNFWRQKGIINDLKKDGVNIFHGLSGELPIGIKNKKIKTVVTIHDLIFMRYPQFYSVVDRNIHFLKFKHAAQVADIVIAISEQTKKDIIEFLKIDPSKIIVIYQGCHHAFKESYASSLKNEIRNKYHLPESYILNVGTIESRKNILSAVKAIKDIDTHLVIVGKKTKYTQQIESYISENKLESKVTFLKGLSITELAVIYQEAKIFIYPSLFEGFGIPIIEALYSKTPVITSINGCFSEAGGPHSIYVNPEDSAEIAFQIKNILADQRLADNMSEKGYDYAQKFNDDIIAKQVFDVYQSLNTNLNGRFY